MLFSKNVLISCLRRASTLRLRNASPQRGWRSTKSFRWREKVKAR